MTTKNLLVELCVEELPPKALHALGKSFAQDIWWKLSTAELLADTSGSSTYGETYIAYASPRRLGVWVKDVLTLAPDRQVRQKLMPVTVALDTNGQPTSALLKKLAALGQDASVVHTLKRAMDGKAEALFLDSVMPGATLTEGLQAALEAALAG
ncbi:MAG: glycine--tRNA ligase subunit beta, partial [Rhodocyclaceae bacterium]|nr:glycine--tRNA ligase subunit beta [Rhodocyclaceae bacterium]